MTRACIGLGSNLADPVRQVRSGITALSQIPESVVRETSSLYRSVPLGTRAQPDFINAVVSLETGLAPVDLLSCLQEIERDHGRDRSNGLWGPRTLDLDILVYGDQLIRTERLTIPHPEILHRNFVLCPLLEIDSNMWIPGMGSAKALLLRIGLQGIHRIEPHES